MTIRLFTEAPLQAHTTLSLPPAAARHAQVRRVQPGDVLVLFDGHGCDWPAEVLAMGRSEVRVQVGAPQPVQRELPHPVLLAVGMPANDRMDTLVEKATELGAVAIQPLLCERAVLRLDGERALKKVAHWQGVAVAASEQCGRARVPHIAPVLTLTAWLAGLASPDRAAPAGQRLLLSPRPGAAPLHGVPPGALCVLSGPEGGLSPAEEAAALAAGFGATGLGPRVLRADTAPLALLAWVGLRG